MTASSRRYHYEVVVSNVGMVYYGLSYADAHAIFVDYLAHTKSLTGRASGESVVMTQCDDFASAGTGTVLYEYDASQHPPHLSEKEVERRNQMWTMAAMGWVRNLPPAISRGLMIGYSRTDGTHSHLVGPPGDYRSHVERHWWLEHTWNKKFEDDLNALATSWPEIGTPADSSMFECSIIEDLNQLPPEPDLEILIDATLRAAEELTAQIILGWEVRTGTDADTNKK